MMFGPSQIDSLRTVQLAPPAGAWKTCKFGMSEMTSHLVWGMRQTGVMLIGHEVQLKSGIRIAAHVLANSSNRPPDLPGNYFLLTPILGYPQLMAHTLPSTQKITSNFYVGFGPQGASRDS